MDRANLTAPSTSLRCGGRRRALPRCAVAAAGAAALLLYVATAAGQATDAMLDCARDTAGGGSS